MSEGVLFAIGSVVFILVSTAILWYGYSRFNEVYEREQSEANGSQEGRTETTDQADNQGR